MAKWPSLTGARDQFGYSERPRFSHWDGAPKTQSALPWRVLSDEEIRDLWEALDAAEAHHGLYGFADSEARRHASA